VARPNLDVLRKAVTRVDAGSYGGYHPRMKVGTKELKNRLSHYLRLVREGEHVQVTDHGTVVAEIRAAREAVNSDEACLQALEQEGIGTRGKRRLADFEPVPSRAKKRLSEIVIEDRD
jgi:antitoxin (DNA-binding transcriptional repressor) of toxin-antitoxin stability system